MGTEKGLQIAITFVDIRSYITAGYKIDASQKLRLAYFTCYAVIVPAYFIGAPTCDVLYYMQLCIYCIAIIAV